MRGPATVTGSSPARSGCDAPTLWTRIPAQAHLPWAARGRWWCPTPTGVSRPPSQRCYRQRQRIITCRQERPARRLHLHRHRVCRGRCRAARIQWRKLAESIQLRTAGACRLARRGPRPISSPTSPSRRSIAPSCTPLTSNLATRDQVRTESVGIFADEHGAAVAGDFFRWWSSRRGWWSWRRRDLGQHRTHGPQLRGGRGASSPLLFTDAAGVLLCGDEKCGGE